MENNELLAQILQELQTQNLLNAKLVEHLTIAQTENKALTESNTVLNEHIKSLLVDNQSTVKNLTVNTLSSDLQNKIEPNFINHEISETIDSTENKNNLSIIKNGQYKKLITSKMNSFKDIILSQSIKLNQKFSFSQKATALFQAIKNKAQNELAEDKVILNIKMPLDILPSVKGLYTNIKNSFIEKAQKTGVSIQVKVSENKDALINAVNSKVTNVYEILFLIGNKRTIAKLKTNFSQSLAMIGIEAHELIYDKKTNSYISVEEVSSTIDDKLANQLKIVKIDNEYIPVALKNLDDEMKLEIIKKMLWPKIMKEIESSLNLSLRFNELKNSNKYMKAIDSFAGKNDLTLETAIHCLENQNNLLENYKGYKTVSNYKDKILESAEKFEIISRNNFIVLQSLVKAASNLEKIIKTLDIVDKDEVLLELSKTKVAQDGKKFFSFATIQKNIAKLLSNRNFVEGVVESNVKNNFMKAANKTNTVKVSDRDIAAGMKM